MTGSAGLDSSIEFPKNKEAAVGKAIAIAILTIARGAPVGAQWLNYPTPGIPRTAGGKPNLAAPTPRTADGKPDLSGVWDKISPKYSRNIAADLKPGDIQPWAEALVAQRKENLGKDYMNVVCLPLGPGYVTDADSTGAEQVKIVQTPGLIILLNPDLTYRQIYMDGRKLETNPNPSWMGYSVGHWDGDTLVVESNGFNDRTWLDHDGHPHTEALRTTERYRRRDFGHMDVEVTLADAGAYAKPWTVAAHAELAPDTEMIEWVCNEERQSVLSHWVGNASDEKKRAVKVDPAVLARYAGTYEEQPKLWRLVPRVVAVTVSGGMLYADMDGRGKVALTAESESSFSGLYGLGVDFRKAGDGSTELFVKHVSGDYRFTRKK